MNSKIALTIAFGLGAAIGSVATWNFVKTKYERIAQEEIDSVKKAYKIQKTSIEESTSEEIEEPLTDEAALYFSNIVHRYDGHNNTTEEGGSDIVSLGSKPYIITPDEYGEIEEFELYGLTYYEGDGVLTDDGDEPIDDIASLVPEDFADHYGEFEDDAVHVRNSRLKIDYEILRDHRAYYEIKNSSLNPSEDE